MILIKVVGGGVLQTTIGEKIRGPTGENPEGDCCC